MSTSISFSSSSFSATPPPPILGFDLFGPGPFISDTLGVLHIATIATIASILFFEIIDACIWNRDVEWTTGYFVTGALGVGICFFIMCSGNLHGAGAFRMLVGGFTTAGTAVATVFAPWGSIRSDTEKYILIIFVVSLGSLATLVQAYIFVRFLLRGRVRSSVDKYVAASRDYTEWMIQGQTMTHHYRLPTTEKKNLHCSQILNILCRCLRRRRRPSTRQGVKKEKSELDGSLDKDRHGDWMRGVFGRKYVRAKWHDPSSLFCTKGIDYVPSVVMIALVATSVFLLVMSLKLHFFFQDGRDRWENGALNGTTNATEALRSTVLRAFDARSRRLFFSTSSVFSSNASVDASSLDRPVVDLDLLLEWLVTPTSVATTAFDRYVDVGDKFYYACMLCNVLCLAIGLVCNVAVASLWRRTWYFARLGAFRGGAQSGEEDRRLSRYSTALTHVGYRIATHFWSFWVLWLVIFLIVWEPLRKLWLYLAGFEDCYYSHCPDPVDVCSPSVAWCARNRNRTAEYSLYCADDYESPAYCVFAGDGSEFPWFSLVVLWIFDLVVVRYGFVECLLVDSTAVWSRPTLLLLGWATLFYYVLVGFAAASLRLCAWLASAVLFSAHTSLFPAYLERWDDVFCGWLATVRLANEGANPIALTAKLFFADALRVSRERMSSVSAVTSDRKGRAISARWRRLCQHARAVGGLALFLRKNPSLAKYSLRRRQRQIARDKCAVGTEQGSATKVRDVDDDDGCARVVVRPSPSPSPSPTPPPPDEIYVPPALRRYRMVLSRGQRIGPSEPPTIPVGASVANLSAK